MICSYVVTAQLVEYIMDCYARYTTVQVMHVMQQRTTITVRITFLKSSPESTRKTISLEEFLILLFLHLFYIVRVLIQLNVNFERNLFLFDAISLNNFRIIGRKNQRQRENKSIILLIFYYYFFFLKEISNLKYKFETPTHLLIIPQLSNQSPIKKETTSKNLAQLFFKARASPLSPLGITHYSIPYSNQAMIYLTRGIFVFPRLRFLRVSREPVASRRSGSWLRYKSIKLRSARRISTGSSHWSASIGRREIPQTGQPSGDRFHAMGDTPG